MNAVRNRVYDIYRVIDANLNRSREGLRVCEEIARFALNDEGLTEKFKCLRHGITACIKFYPLRLKGIVASRDATRDVGRKAHVLERKRSDIRDVSLANMERVKESLRVLEEFSKLVDDKIACRFKRFRFKSYGLEKELIERF